MSYSFRHIPKELWIEIGARKHVEHKEVYRALKDKTNINENDFLPSNIQNQYRFEAHKLSHYSVSLFCDKLMLEKIIGATPRMKNMQIACGFTSHTRGVSHEKNSNSHVDYYLFDYIDNSPAPDFK